ncbi:MAG: hypothetical protein M3132_12055 [Actinomycetia bacterium]|nr:hypothetical protein [Actinomycetes bacterium]
MKRSVWLGIAVGTITASLAIWFGLFAFESNRTVGLIVISVGIVFAMYVMAAFDGVDDAATVAFHSSLYAIVAASTLLILFTVTGSPSYVVASPVIALGVGGVVGIPPVGNRFRMLSRAAAVILVAIIAVSIYWVDVTVYALVAPLLPLPAVGLADRFFDQGAAIVAE